MDAAKRMLESQKYRGSPPGGADAFFTYEAGHEPALAFLVGRAFDIGTPSAREQRSDWYLLDGTLYASGSIPLRFPPERYRPYLLPGPMACGRAMDFGDFMNFVTAPGPPAEFTLRLRPGLEPGLISPPPPPRQAPPPPGPPGARPAAPVPMVGGEMTLYGRPSPRDPAPVLLPSGRPLTADRVQALLPRLASITLELALVQRGRVLEGWEVMRFRFDDAVVVTGRGDTRVRPLKPCGRRGPRSAWRRSFCSRPRAPPARSTTPWPAGTGSACARFSSASRRCSTAPG